MFASWRKLSDQDVRLLAFMANTALDAANDKQQARIYFGGREHLLIGLGRDLPYDDEKATNAAYESLRRVIARLVAAGAISRTTHARDGRRQAYKLHLDGPRPTVSVPLLPHAQRAP